MIKSLQINSHQLKNLKQKNSSIRLNKLNKKLNRIYLSPREQQCNSSRVPKISPCLKEEHEHRCLRAFVESKIIKVSPSEKKKQDVIKSKHKRFNTQYFIRDIIKLPERYQLRKQQASHKKILNISRPCRLRGNNTEIRKFPVKNKNNFNHINMSSDYSKMNKQKFIKNKSFATIESVLCSESSQKEKPVVFPDSNFDQLKTTKYTHTQKNNTPLPTKNKQYLNLYSKQPSKHKQAENISKRDALKIKTCYQKQQLKFVNEAIKRNLTYSLNPNLSKLFELPSEKYLPVYVHNYKPIGEQMTEKFKQIIYSSAFQIHRVNQVPNEKIYFGEMKNGLYHGLGVMINQYEIRQGIWEFGFIVQGIVKNSFQYYKGAMKQNLKHGYGQCVSEDGGLYQGSWKNGLKSGQGYLKHSNYEYLGQWQSGFIEGKGVLKTYFSVYEGNFKNSFKEGLGKQSFENGDYFEGSFEADYPEGEGKYYWKSGQYYTGIFSEGKRQGEGIFIAPGILQFKGHYKNDRPSGQGKVYYINGDEYVGLFFKGQRNGLGDLMCKNRKIVYSGDWVNDSLVYQFKQLK